MGESVKEKDRQEIQRAQANEQGHDPAAFSNDCLQLRHIEPGKARATNQPGGGKNRSEGEGQAGRTALHGLQDLADRLAVVIGGGAAGNRRLFAARQRANGRGKKLVVVFGRAFTRPFTCPIARSFGDHATVWPVAANIRRDLWVRACRHEIGVGRGLLHPDVQRFLDRGQRRFGRVVKFLGIVGHFRRRLVRCSLAGSEPAGCQAAPRSHLRSQRNPVRGEAAEIKQVRPAGIVSAWRSNGNRAH